MALTYPKNIAPSSTLNRPINEKLNDFISLKDFPGVDSTGASDSRVGVQMAIDSGKQLLVDGIYKIVGSLNFQHLAGMRGNSFNGGASIGSGFIFYNTGTSPAVTVPNIKDNVFLSIEDIFFKASSWDATTGANGHGLDISGTIALTRVQVMGFKKIGIYMHHDLLSNGPYESLLTNVRCLYNGQHGMVIGNGANSLALVNCEWKWNGAPSYLTAPSATGSYDGLYVDAYDDGSGYPTYNPEGLTVIGGDASYNSRYGYNFQAAAYANLMPGYAEFNKQTNPENMNIGNDFHDSYIKTGRISSTTINFAASYYKFTNTVIVGGTNYGSGNTLGLKDNWFNNNLITYFSGDSGHTKGVGILPNTVTGDASLNAYGGAVLTIGNSSSTALPLNANIQFAGVNTTGTGSALLGANSPASVLTAPYKWIRVLASDGTVCFMPIWK
jgi:hypothetical protein